MLISTPHNVLGFPHKLNTILILFEIHSKTAGLRCVKSRTFQFGCISNKICVCLQKILMWDYFFWIFWILNFFIHNLTFAQLILQYCYNIELYCQVSTENPKTQTMPPVNSCTTKLKITCNKIWCVLVFLTQLYLCQHSKRKVTTMSSQPCYASPIPVNFSTQNWQHKFVLRCAL